MGTRVWHRRQIAALLLNPDQEWNPATDSESGPVVRVLSEATDKILDSHLKVRLQWEATHSSSAQ